MNLNLDMLIQEYLPKIIKIKDGAYVINLDESKLIGTCCLALYINGNNATYFDSFEI